MTVNEWLKNNRQWKREHNIAHARYMLAAEKLAGALSRGMFWTLVLEGLGA